MAKVSVQAQASDEEPRLVYIIYDFTIGRGIKDNLIAARDHFSASAEVRVDFPEPGSLKQGEIWNDIVRPKLYDAQQVIAYVDKPNANVGFEVGYALGCGKSGPRAEPIRVALALHATEAIPSWCKQPPFDGFNIRPYEDEQDLIGVIGAGDGFWVRDRPRRGKAVYLLCPKNGTKYVAAAAAAGEWRELDASAWALKDLPAKLDEVGAIVWMIPPSTSERDGPENTALAVVAGFASASGIEVKIIRHEEAREPLDIVPVAHRIRDLNEFKKVIREVRASIDQGFAREAAASGVLQALELSRPDVGELPSLGQGAELRDRFIGRQRWLQDYYTALDGLSQRWSGLLPKGRNPTQIFWYHGLGGMGKTWLLRRAMLDTAERNQAAKVAYWEWDNDAWRGPLDRAPDVAEDIFAPIAYRLAQLYGVSCLDRYWKAEQRIGAASAQARSARQRFNHEYGEWRVKKQTSPALGRALDRSQLSRVDRELSAGDQQKVFRRWIDEGGFEFLDRDASMEAPRLRREALARCVSELAKQAPLVMVFDTCEVLSAEAEEALRGLTIEICKENQPVLVLIASRLMPDLGLPRGSKEGWRETLGDLLKIEAFDDLTLTTREIEEYLRRYDPALEAPDEIAMVLHQVTLGVPLALRVLVEMDTGKNGLKIELDAWGKPDMDSASRDNALSSLYETMARRFLQHLLSRADEREEDLSSVITLAVLTEADSNLLAAVWGQAWRLRLRELGRQYSLMSQGEDLHPVVRFHLRRFLREGEYAKRVSEVVRDLQAAASRLALEISRMEDMQTRLRRVNLESWAQPTATAALVAPSLVFAMMHEQRLDQWFVLAAEVARTSKVHADQQLFSRLEQIVAVQGRNLYVHDFVKRHWQSVPAPIAESLLDWLEHAEKSGSWSKAERTGGRIIRALRGLGGPDALQRLSTALSDVEEPVPLRANLGEGLFAIAIRPGKAVREPMSSRVSRSRCGSATSRARHTARSGPCTRSVETSRARWSTIRKPKT